MLERFSSQRNTPDTIECPIDRHRCDRLTCLDMPEEPDCMQAARHLAQAAKPISIINETIFRQYENNERPTVQELQDSVNINPAIHQTAERLGVNKPGFFQNVINAFIGIS